MKTFLSYLSICLILSSCANQSASLEPSTAGVQLAVFENTNDDIDEGAYYYFEHVIPATGKRVFIFDPNYNAWAVYNENGERINVGKASGGASYCPDIGRSCKTVVGTFKIIAKRGANCKSSIYPLNTGGGAPMPYCMLFDSGGYAIHGSNHVPNYNASHGCIRIKPAAAKWLHEEFLPMGATVIVLPYHSEQV